MKKCNNCIHCIEYYHNVYIDFDPCGLNTVTGIYACLGEAGRNYANFNAS